jgi:general secretion pathway protein L
LKGLPSFVRAEPQAYVLHFLLQRFGQIAKEALPGNALSSLLKLQQQQLSQVEPLEQSAHPAWRWSAVLATLAALFWLAQSLFANYQLYRLAQTQRTEVSQMFQQVFPNLVAYEGAALDPVAMLLSQLRQQAQSQAAQQAGGVLTLLNFAAPILRTESRITLVNLEYRNGELELSLRAPDLLALDELRARLASSGSMQVSLGSNTVDPNGQMLTGRIKLKLRPAGAAS